MVIRSIVGVERGQQQTGRDGRHHERGDQLTGGGPDHGGIVAVRHAAVKRTVDVPQPWRPVYTRFVRRILAALVLTLLVGGAISDVAGAERCELTERPGAPAAACSALCVQCACCGIKSFATAVVATAPAELSLSVFFPILHPTTFAPTFDILHVPRR